MSHLSAIVLAAASGARMRSTRPKPLHPLCGKPMVVYVLEALAALEVHPLTVVAGATSEQISKKLVEVAPDISVDLVLQPSSPGTASAVAAALAAHDDLDLDDDADVLVVPADVPLVGSDTLRRLVEAHRRSGAAATVLSIDGDRRSGYGGLVEGRPGEVGAVAGAGMADGASATGIYCFRRSLLAPALRRVHPDSHPNDAAVGAVVAVLHDAGHRTAAWRADDADELHDVNDRVDLAVVEARLRHRINSDWQRRGVTLVDPSRTIIETTVDLDTDVTLFPGTLLQGATVIGKGAEIGPDTHLVDCAVGPGARVRHTVGRDAEVGSFADVGPFAVLEPGASVAPATTTGPHHVESAPDPGVPE